MLFLIFSHINNMIMLDVAKVSNNEVNICRSSTCEQKVQTCFQHFFLLLARADISIVLWGVTPSHSIT